MKTTMTRAFFSLTSIWALLGSPAVTRGDAAAGIVIVTHASNPQPSLSSADLRKVFSGGIKQWPNGAVVVVGIIPSDAPETVYLAKALDSSPTALLRRIQEQVFRGEMRRPAVLHNSNECFAFARSNPGALCAAVAVNPTPPGVQTVSVR
jgi:hypothetical protein